MRSFGFHFLVFVLISLFIFGSFCAKAYADPAGKVADADNAMRQAFSSVFDAEGAGANVSDLIASLDEAGRILADAETAIRIGNLREAESKANACIGIAGNIKTEATSLKSTALTDTQRSFRYTSAFSVAGMTVFAVALVFVWRRFKRGYSKRVLGMRPEVVADAEA